ncbi:hypothetical protein BC937DRAFT_89014 [Endogone sp. FLAS-F59071]|nr:hypothetical protein BC937DRAFT_89014 [Endogone sp. FLAS-F59071]|eukprot:RUS18224.1 hypothetical protein BC937DRAFT_89014 [Endogone sp. FLAS-F59071]
MDQAVFETLSHVLADDPNVRIGAELRLRELEQMPETWGLRHYDTRPCIMLQPEFPISLTKLTLTKEIAIPQPYNLKNYTDSHWTSKTDRFRGPEPPEATKQVVRELVFSGLSDSDSKIRIACAYVVSKIAQNDWPEQWPNLFDLLLAHLKTGSAEQVHGAMRVLTEFISANMTDQQFPQIAPKLCPELLRVLTTDNVYSPRTRGRAVAIFRHCIDMLNTLKEEHPDAADRFLQPVMSLWTEAFLGVLRHRAQGSEAIQMAEYGLKMEVVKTLSLILSNFPKYIIPYLNGILEPIWLDLIQLRERYVGEFVRESGPDFETFQDSDGEVIGFETLLFEQFEFFGLASRKKSTRSLFLGPKGDGELLREVVYIILSYMQMTEDQVEAWLTDANQFVADEEDDTFSFNVRIAAEDLLLILLEKFPEKLFDALSLAVQKHLEESNKARAAGNTDWWKIQEACLLAIGRASDELIESIQDKESGVQFDLAGLFNHVVLEHMKSTGASPFLLLFVYYKLVLLVCLLLHELLPVFCLVELCCIDIVINPYSCNRVSLRSRSRLRLREPICSHPACEPVESVRGCCSAGIAGACSHHPCEDFRTKSVEQEVVVPFQPSILEGACQLLPSATEEALMLVLETIMSAAKLDENVTARYEALIVPLVLEVWRKYPADHIVAGVVMDLFEELARNRALYHALSARALPLLHGSSIDLVTALVRGGPSPLPLEYSQQIFLPLMHLLWTTEDKEVLQSGEDCVKFLIQKDSMNIIQWRDETGKSGLDYIVQFVGKLLQPAQSESAALLVGDVLVGTNLAPVLPDLLNAVVYRLSSAQSPTFIQSLVLVFAHLILSQQEIVIEFLANVNIEGRSGLQVLMNAWCENYESFQGYYSLKVSAIALSKLFLSTDSRVQSLTVQGDLIVNQSNKIMTRSRTRQAPDQYTILPVPVKIVKILVADLQSNLEAEPAAEEESVESGDEENVDWEDVDESPFAPAEEYALLSELIDACEDFEDEDDEANDTDLQNDPVFQTNLREYLIDFFRNCAVQNVNHFVDICQHNLSDLDKAKLEEAIKQQQ